MLRGHPLCALGLHRRAHNLMPSRIKFVIFMLTVYPDIYP